VFSDQVPRNVQNLMMSSPDAGLAAGPALALPLGKDDSQAGVLIAVRRPGSTTFDDHELQVASSFADQAALALQHAQMQLNERELEVVADRDRIARDLHDQVIQRLFAIGLAMNGTHRRTKTPAVAERLADHINQLHEVIQDIRTAIFDLQAGPAAEQKLRATLNNLISDLTADTTIRTTVKMSGPVDSLKGALAHHVQAVVVEAVSNAVRHSRAEDLVIAVSVGEEVSISVTDNGIGMPEIRASSGLRNLEQRATEAGGRLLISSPAGGGTHLAWSAPVR